MSTFPVRVYSCGKNASNFRVYFLPIPFYSCVETAGIQRNRPSFLQVPAGSGVRFVRSGGVQITRLGLLKNDEWLVIDYINSSLLQISKDGQLKVTHKYTPTPQNAVLFGSNILAIRTTNCVNFYRV
jgi:hypothetical protein